VTAASAQPTHRLAGVAVAVRRAWASPLWAHALLLAALLAAAAPFVELGRSFTIDEGAYGVQVRALDRGNWNYQYVGQAVDPGGSWLPLYHPASDGERWFAYVKQPAYPTAMLGATKLVGESAGPYLLGILGALGVAVAAWLLAGEVSATARRTAFWLAAASPVAINAFALWAHAPTAALAGFAAWAGLRLGREPEARWVALLLACLAGGALLRAEGALFAVALALGLLTAGLSRCRRSLRVGIPAACVIVAGLATVVNARWRSSIVGISFPLESFRGEDGSPFSNADGSFTDWAEGRLEGAWNSLLQGSVDRRRETVVVAGALVLTVFAARVLRRRRVGWRRDAAVALSGAVVLYALRFGAVGTDPIPGMLAAWPLALLGLGLLTRSNLRSAAPLFVATTAFGFAVLATQYRFGGGREWGGRFFFPFLVPLAVLASLGLRQVLGSEEAPRRALAGFAVVLALLPTLTGLRMLRVSRQQTGAIVEEVTAGGPALVVTHVQTLPPFAWRTYPEVGWMAVQPGQFTEAASRLEQRGVQGWVLLAPATTSATEMAGYRAVDVTGPEARSRGWRTLQLSLP
jgi:hypothetical protein